MTFTAPASFITRPTLQGTFGMSASTHWLATASSQAVLERDDDDAAAALGVLLSADLDPGGAVVEDRLGDAVIDGLSRRGHVITRAGDWALGRLSAVCRDSRTGLLQAANPRGAQGYAAGR